VFSFYFVLLGASATDVLANYLSISLNVVLTSFRFLAIAVPLIVFPVTYRICKEMQSVPTAGQRKRANIVLRSAVGGYTTSVPSSVLATPCQSGSAAPRRRCRVRPGDGGHPGCERTTAGTVAAGKGRRHGRPSSGAGSPDSSRLPLSLLLRPAASAPGMLEPAGGLWQSSSAAPRGYFAEFVRALIAGMPRGAAATTATTRATKAPKSQPALARSTEGLSRNAMSTSTRLTRVAIKSKGS